MKRQTEPQAQDRSSMETTAGPGKTQQCGSCDESSSSCWCLDCNEALCGVCLSAHRRVTLTRSHRILNQPPAGGASSPPPSPPIKFCSLHPSEQLRLYCVTCSQLTCRDCQLMAHISHRYHFVSEVLDSMKKQLQVLVQPVRAHSDRVRKSLLDMETRIQDIVETQSQMKTELQQSYNFIIERLRKRMEIILKETKTVYEVELKEIQRRMEELKQLQQNQQSVTEMAEKAQNTNDLSALLAYGAQIQSQLKCFPEQGFSPPQTMAQLKVVTDRMSLETILKFGVLQVSWIPFSVSRTSNQSRDSLVAASSSSSSSSASASASASASTSSVTSTCPAVNLHPVSFGLSLPCTVLGLVQPSLVLNGPAAPHQNQPTAVLLPSSHTVYQVSCVPQFPMMLSQTPSYTFPNPQPLEDRSCVAVTSGPVSSPGRPFSETGPQSSSLKRSPVVRAVADSACGRRVKWVSVRRRKPAENEPTSTVFEDAIPAASAPEVSNRDAREPSSLTGHPDYSQSQWQPRVSLFRLPVSPPCPGCPLPGFRLVPGEDEDEIYMEEMSEDTQSLADDVKDDKEPPSLPESPVTLQMVWCCACGSAYGSIICSSCGRGFHRDCHLPPVGPDIWSEWTCSLCQDLSDPSDPYSSERPRRPQSPCLSLLDQRRCESLLLHLKVEGCGRLSEAGFVAARLNLMSERLSLRRSPSYQTSAEFLSDVSSVFRDASQDDGVLNKLQETFQSRLMETFSPELHSAPSSSTEGGDGSERTPVEREVNAGESKESERTPEKQEVKACESKVMEMRKRLRQFLDLVETSASKRRKTDKMEERDGGQNAQGQKLPLTSINQ
ncbi:transcription intermediary factor 1-beta isoform X2 [Chaetodon auriga]|uniref:transcription intermediary factor 1-beta isoform X2 n=1 Tax=Chaetodon auriga TaxID=39042 RepID=UPI004032CDF7